MDKHMMSFFYKYKCVALTYYWSTRGMQRAKITGKFQRLGDNSNSGLFSCNSPTVFYSFIIHCNIFPLTLTLTLTANPNPNPKRFNNTKRLTSIFAWAKAWPFILLNYEISCAY